MLKHLHVTLLFVLFLHRISGEQRGVSRKFSNACPIDNSSTSRSHEMHINAHIMRALSPRPLSPLTPYCSTYTIASGCLGKDNAKKCGLGPMNHRYMLALVVWVLLEQHQWVAILLDPYCEQSPRKINLAVIAWQIKQPSAWKRSVAATILVPEMIVTAGTGCSGSSPMSPYLFTFWI